MGLSQDWSGKLVGEYRLQRRLGGGSFGEVYLAEDVRERSQVAVKLIKAPLTRREGLKAFLNEARSMRLRHPHIVSLLDFGLSEEDLPFLVMEYVAGGTLRDHYPKGSRVPLDTVVDLTMQLASALQYAHDHRLIHRDVKPENMLCRTDGTVLLSDFGIASVAHASSSASAYRSFGGTLPYMAPEQHAGKPRPASDQYALAVVVYEWLAGTRPFQGTVPELVSQHLYASPPSLLDLVQTLPAQVEQVVFKALSKQPQERFARVDDFALALQVASQPHLVPPSPAPFSPPLTAPPEWKQSVPDQASTADQERGILSPSPPPGSKTRADQALPGAIPPPILSSAHAITSLEEGPGRNVPLTPAPVSRPAKPRSILNRRVFFIFSLVLLAMLSGSSLLHFGLGVQRTPTLSSSQAIAATATAVAQTYATAIARQGVMFGFDAAHTYYNPYEQMLGPGTISRLTPLWSFASSGCCYITSSSPAVAGGMVYVGSGRFYAFDATCRQNCQPLWSFGTGGSIFSPTVAGGVIYVDNGEDNGRFYAFDATCRKNCQPLWSFVTAGGAVAVAGGMVYLGSGSGKFYAFDATCRKNCQPLWSFDTGDYNLSSPAVAGGMVYLGSGSGKFYAFDATCRKNCQPLWSFDTGDSNLSSPAVAGGMAYVSSSNKLYAFDAACRKSCQPLWSFATGGSSYSSPTVAGGVVYIGSFDGKLYTFDAACRQNCQPLWSFDTGSQDLSSPTVAEGMVYVSSSRGKLYAFGLAS